MLFWSNLMQQNDLFFSIFRSLFRVNYTSSIHLPSINFKPIPFPSHNNRHVPPSINLRSGAWVLQLHVLKPERYKDVFKGGLVSTTIGLVSEMDLGKITWKMHGKVISLSVEYLNLYDLLHNKVSCMLH